MHGNFFKEKFPDGNFSNTKSKNFSGAFAPYPPSRGLRPPGPLSSSPTTPTFLFKTLYYKKNLDWNSRRESGIFPVIFKKAGSSCF
jgi:hypothetical protein